jgi:hypothetical protein
VLGSLERSLLGCLSTPRGVQMLTYEGGSSRGGLASALAPSVYQSSATADDLRLRLSLEHHDILFRLVQMLEEPGSSVHPSVCLPACRRLPACLPARPPVHLSVHPAGSPSVHSGLTV